MSSVFGLLIEANDVSNVIGCIVKIFHEMGETGYCVFHRLRACLSDTIQEILHLFGFWDRFTITS